MIEYNRSSDPYSVRNVVCPQCKGAGMIAMGRAIQYCLCATGRAKKKFWFDLPADMRAEEEAVCPTLPDAEDLRGVV